MGEAKRHRDAAQNDPWRAGLDDLARRLTDQGQMVKAGFVSLRIEAIPREADQTHLDEMEMAFMAGAQHLFHSIMSILDDDAEPTPDDLRRMDLIDRELKAWIDRFKLKHFEAEGTA